MLNLFLQRGQSQQVIPYIANQMTSFQTRSIKKVFLNISQNSQENICVGVSFQIKLPPEAPTKVFSCKFCESTFFIGSLRATAFVTLWGSLSVSVIVAFHFHHKTLINWGRFLDHEQTQLNFVNCIDSESKQSLDRSKIIMRKFWHDSNSWLLVWCPLWLGWWLQLPVYPEKNSFRQNSFDLVFKKNVRD